MDTHNGVFNLHLSVQVLGSTGTRTSLVVEATEFEASSSGASIN